MIQGIEKMRASGRLAARVLQMAGALVKPGVRTNEIDEAVHAMIIEAGMSGACGTRVVGVNKQGLR